MTDLSQEVVERVAEQLEGPLPHHVCEDPWYSCPLSAEGSAGAAEQDLDPQKCYCYAEEVNVERTNAAALLRALRGRLAEVERERDEALRRIPTTLGAASTEP